jgi:hypothetical protein
MPHTTRWFYFISVSPQFWLLAVDYLLMLNQTQSYLITSNKKYDQVSSYLNNPEINYVLKKGNTIKQTIVCQFQGCPHSCRSQHSEQIPRINNIKTVPAAYVDSFKVLVTSHVVTWNVCAWFGKTAENWLWLILYHRLCLAEVTKTQGKPPYGLLNTGQRNELLTLNM